MTPTNGIFAPFVGFFRPFISQWYIW